MPVVTLPLQVIYDVINVNITDSCRQSVIVISFDYIMRHRFALDDRKKPLSIKHIITILSFKSYKKKTK